MKLMSLKAAILSASLVMVGVSDAATYNMRHHQNHGHWSSMELYLGQERFFRAVNAVAYSDGFLAVDHYPGNCGDPVISTRIETDEIQSETAGGVYYRADMRVDRREVQNGLVEVQLERGDSGMYLFYMVPEKGRLLQDMRNGNTLRFQFSGDNIDTWYLEFGLRGSMAAINRAAAMCRQASQGPEEFFRQEGAPQQGAESFF